MEDLIPSLSLSRECQREADRRAAVKLSHHELQILADKLICDWYQDQDLIRRCFGKIGKLEVELALASRPDEVINPQPKPQHFQWARELLGRA